MQPPDLPETTPTPRRNPAESGDGSVLDWVLQGLPLQAFQLRSQYRHALHPVEAALQYHRASTQGTSAPCDATISFEQAESHYRAGSQGLRLSEIPQFPQFPQHPQLPQQLRELSSLSVVDRAGRKALRKWAENADLIIDEAEFLSMDSTRRAAAIQAIGTFSENHQVLFFTCHPEHAGEMQNLAGAKSFYMTA